MQAGQKSGLHEPHLRSSWQWSGSHDSPTVSTTIRAWFHNQKSWIVPETWEKFRANVWKMPDDICMIEALSSRAILHGYGMRSPVPGHGGDLTGQGSSTRSYPPGADSAGSSHLHQCCGTGEFLAAPLTLLILIDVLLEGLSCTFVTAFPEAALSVQSLELSEPFKISCNACH